MKEPKSYIRTLVVGDIHGNLKAFKEALHKCDYNPEEDKIIFIGDLVDGGPESIELLIYIYQYIGDFILVSGNHEDLATPFLEDLVDDGEVAYNCNTLNQSLQVVWLNNGGQATTKSFFACAYSKFNKLFPKFSNSIEKSNEFENTNDLNIFRKVAIANICLGIIRKGVSWYIESDKLFIHGGFDPILPIEAQNDTVLKNDRDMIYSLCEAAASDRISPLENTDYTKYESIFIGHTCTQHLASLRCFKDVKIDKTMPLNIYNVWDIDTGAGNIGGKLTIMDIKTKQYWQSDAVKTN